MNKIGEAVTGIRTFTGEVKAELKKSSWPTRPELIESTIVVIVASAILGAFVGASDLILMSLLRVIIH